MAAKKPKKHNRKKYKIRESSEDLVAIQIAARFRRVPRGFKPTRQIVEEMIREKARRSTGYWSGNHCIDCSAGPNPPGIELTIIRWQNPERRSSHGWRYPIDDAPVGRGQDEAWGTLRRTIEEGRFAVQFIR